MAGQTHPLWPVTVDPTYLCWLWQGALTADGYGLLDGQAAHRAVYEKEVGPIADGLFCEHRCRVRRCCNPKHIELVGQSTNEKRKKWAWRVKLKKCQFGHDLYLHGRRTKTGGHICLRCG